MCMIVLLVLQVVFLSILFMGFAVIERSLSLPSASILLISEPNRSTEEI